MEAALKAMRAHDAIETAPPGWCRALDEVTAATVAHMMTDGISATKSLSLFIAATRGPEINAAKCFFRRSQARNSVG